MAGTRQDYLTGFTTAGKHGDIRDIGAPTEFVGHTFRDSAGQDWRWNTVYKKYFRSYGESPGQKLQLGAINRAKELGNLLQNKGPIEGRRRKTAEPPILEPKEQAINWFKSNMELPELSDQTKRSLVEGALSMQASFDLEDPDRFTWNDAIDFGSELNIEPILTQEQRNQRDANELPPNDEETEVNAGGVTTPNEIELNKDEVTPSQRRLRSAKDFDNELKDQSTARQNWNNMTHFERTQAKAFARGNPLKEMRIRRAKSTFDENK